jgi:hypothetical protein
MSTYLSATPTFLPTVQPYEPNFQLYAGALQMKQSQYDTNRKKISNLYGSLLNSPLTRDSNIKARDEFFNTIDYEIKKLANVDLSLEQNVNQAVNLFSGLYDNKNIIKDMMWTKNYDAEMARGEGFRLCTDPEECGGQFWQGGLDALQWQREEFRNMSDDEAMSYGDVRYTPYINVGEKANEIFKENGWDVKVDSFSPDGKWIVTTKNGEQIVGPLLGHFQSIIGKDPAVAEYYRTKSYVDRKSWVASKKEEYGSEDAALQAYINDATTQINEVMSQINNQSKDAKNNTSQIAEDVKKNIDDGKLNNTDRVQAEYDRLFGESKKFEETELETSKAITTTQNAMASQNLRLQAETIDGAMGLLGLNNDLLESAKVLAYRNYESTFKVNEWAKAEQEHNWRIQEARYKAELDFEVQKQLLEMELKGNEILNQKMMGMINSDVDISEDAVFKDLQENVKKAQQAVEGDQEIVIKRTADAQKSLIATGGVGSTQARQDYIQLAKTALDVLSYNEGIDKLEGNTYTEKWNQLQKATSDAERYTILEDLDFDKVNSLLTEGAIEQIYGVTTKFYESNDYNNTNRVYLKGIKAEVGNNILLANQNKQVVAQWNDAVKKATGDVVSWLETNGSDEFRPYYKHLLDKNMNVRTSEEMAISYAREEFETYKNSRDIEKVKEVARGIWSNYPSKRAEYGNTDAGRDKYIKDYVAEYKNSQEYKDKQPHVLVWKGGRFDPDAMENAKKIPVSKFFTEAGDVANQYLEYNNWAPGDDTEFWVNYRRATKAYKGGKAYEEAGSNLWKYVGGGAAVGSLGGPAGSAIGGAAGFITWLGAGESEAEAKAAVGNPLLDELKWGFNKANVVKGNEKLLGLIGGGSEAAKSLDGVVDYNAPLSLNVQDEQSFLNDAFMAERSKNVFFSFGKPGGSVPLMSDAKAEEFVKQLIGEATTASKGSKPSWIGSFNPIAGGKAGYQSYTFTLTDPSFLKKYIGTKENKGAYYDYFQENKNGNVTIYLNDDVAQNSLHQRTSKSPFEKILDYAGEVPVSYGSYDNISTLKLSRNPTGAGYYVNGAIATGKDNKNNYIFEPHNQFYPSGTMDPNMINEYYGNILSQINQQLNPTGQMN